MNESIKIYSEDLPDHVPTDLNPEVSETLS